jgi:NAD dependent epimerase/dehydratase family enzyme
MARIRRRIIRVSVVLVGAGGLLGLLESVAQARIGANHCRPRR